MVEDVRSCCDRIPETNNLEEEGFVLAHGFQGFSSSWQGGHSIIEQLTSWRPESRGKGHPGRSQGKTSRAGCIGLCL
jgi:hypothetical protein